MPPTSSLTKLPAARRDCLLIATTDQPEQFDPAIYRRFVERGLIIDIGEFWEKPENLREVVRTELRRRRLPPPEPDEEMLNAAGAAGCIRSFANAVCALPRPTSAA